jgi:hypothetical protein
LARSSRPREVVLNPSLVYVQESFTKSKFFCPGAIRKVVRCPRELAGPGKRYARRPDAHCHHASTEIWINPDHLQRSCESVEYCGSCNLCESPPWRGNDTGGVWLQGGKRRVVPWKRSLSLWVLSYFRPLTVPSPFLQNFSWAFRRHGYFMKSSRTCVYDSYFTFSTFGFRSSGQRRRAESRPRPPGGWRWSWQFWRKALRCNALRIAKVHRQLAVDFGGDLAVENRKCLR